MAFVAYKDDNIIFFLSYLSERNKFKVKVIISKQNIRLAVNRNKMRRKVKFLFNMLDLNDNFCCKVIVRKLYDFKINEYKIIKEKIIKNVFGSRK